jgi:hypothetical protein
MRTSSAVALVAVLAMCGTGCSLPGVNGSSSPPSDPPATAPASAAASGASAPSAPASASESPAATASGTTGPTPADPSQPSGGDQLGRVVATRLSAIGGQKVTLQLYRVERDGATSHVNFTLSSPETSVRAQVGSTLSDENRTAIDTTGDTSDGVQLVDGKNAKLYLVASDGKGQCLCSRGLSSSFLRNNVPALFSATFAAPPTSVAQVDVKIPNFGTVRNVPVE